MHRVTCLVSLLLLVGSALAATLYEDLSHAFAMVNAARQAKGVPKLSWDANLASDAQAWANAMATDMVKFSHAPSQYRQNQGENIYDRESGQGDVEYDNPVTTAMQGWLSQAPLYDDKPVTGNEKWLHWSQCMWSNTTSIGCARAYSISVAYKVYDVCRFSPLGNIVGEKPF
ncbi:hypothetical protein PLICBS_002392 [Purpureocillium lilacinum]|uniref:uncharacterized protein n=1 Tax=Purpureocillium lilacinum TaxID=33203 RepID=UPI00208D0EBB|nr:hypothetical protein PLICBS_002392 [Purpureocillium lilacinum]